MPDLSLPLTPEAREELRAKVTEYVESLTIEQSYISFLSFNERQARNLAALLTDYDRLAGTLKEAHEDIAFLIGTECPEHVCEYDTDPDRGGCGFHDRWVEAISRAGVFDEDKSEFDEAPTLTEPAPE